MKFSSLFLFITLLVILIVIVLFSKYNNSSKEGLTNYNNETGRQFAKIKIMRYSQTNDIIKVLDNIYYDYRNGNIIEIVEDKTITIPPAPTSETSETADATLKRMQSQITNVIVTKRSNDDKITYKEAALPEKESTAEKSKIGNTMTYIPNSTDPFIINTEGDATDKYTILYTPLGIYTHILIINSKKKTIECSFIHYGDKVGGANYAESVKNISAFFISPSPVLDDVNNGKDVSVTSYNGTKNIHQLTKFVWIDKTNGYWVVHKKTPDEKVIYDGGFVASGSIRQNFRQQTDGGEITIVVDKGGYLNIYFGINNFISICVLGYSATNSTFELKKNIVIDVNSPTNTQQSKTGGSSSSSGTTSSSGSGTAQPPTDNLGPYSDYYRWLAYWNATGKTGIFSQDYIEKTQIVPPVCPACPACPASTGICTNCGGNGGSGTTNAPVSSQQQQPGVVRSVVDTTGKTITGVVDTTADVLKSTGSGTADLLKSAGSGTTDLLKSAGSGTTDLLKSAGSGTYDFITGKWLDSNGNEQPANGRMPPSPQGQQSISGSQAPYSSRSNQQNIYSSGQGAGRMASPDNYNYNGALTDKGGNYIPVTADFSAFGR